LAGCAECGEEIVGRSVVQLAFDEFGIAGMVASDVVEWN
jgi:hypothetical protein